MIKDTYDKSLVVAIVKATPRLHANKYSKLHQALTANVAQRLESLDGGQVTYDDIMLAISKGGADLMQQTTNGNP